MRFSQERPVKIVMLGAGGTGGHIAPHLYRLLYALNRPVRFIICDGDVVEPKNLVRQNFIPADLGENKAKVLAERYSTVFGMETEYVPNFVEDENQLKALLTQQSYFVGDRRDRLAPEQVILIGAVDNNRSRQLCHRVFYQAEELIYWSYCGGTTIRSLQSCRASQFTIPVLMPACFAFSDFASTMPCRSSVEPHTATAFPRSVGSNIISTEA